MHYDRVKASTATTGTGTITVGSALTGFRAFTGVVADGDTVSYILTNGTSWELGRGVWNNTAGTLTRVPSLSSNANAAINLVGSSIVAVTVLASDLNAIADAGVAMAIALG